VETINYAAVVPWVIETMTLCFRAVAGGHALIAILIWWMFRGQAERPPHDRRLNDRAWNWFNTGAIIGSVGFIALDVQYFTVTGKTIGDVIAMIVWWCFATAGTIRVASRSDRPRFVYLGTSIFVIGMPLYVWATAG
jgi:hypothetical protein